MFHRANWTDWPNTLPFFTIALSVHHIGLDAFQLAFAAGDTGLDDEQELRDAVNRQSIAHVAADGPDIHLDGARLLSLPFAEAISQCSEGVDDDAMSRERVVNAISHKAALAFMGKNFVSEAIHVVASGASATTAASDESISEGHRRCVGARAAVGTRSFSLEMLHRGHLLPNFFAETMGILGSSHFNYLNSTDLLRSKILKLLMSPAGLVHQLVRVRVEGFPYALFGLLQLSTLRYAAELLAKPKFLRDRWSNYTFQDFASPQQICSDVSMNFLAILAKHAYTTTVTTERIHSKRPDLQFLAAPHTAFAAANWVARPFPGKDEGGMAGFLLSALGCQAFLCCCHPATWSAICKIEPRRVCPLPAPGHSGLAS